MKVVACYADQNVVVTQVRSVRPPPSSASENSDLVPPSHQSSLYAIKPDKDFLLLSGPTLFTYALSVTI